MKRILVLIVSTTLLIACNSDESKTAGTTTTTTNGTDSASITSIQWIDSVVQDLGKIKEGQVLEISYRFRNTGNNPLVIKNVFAGCGCTVAEKPEAPIMPGQEGVIKAKFDSKGRTGTQHKDLTVQANTTPSETYRLLFNVEVEKSN